MYQVKDNQLGFQQIINTYHISNSYFCRKCYMSPFFRFVHKKKDDVLFKINIILTLRGPSCFSTFKYGGPLIIKQLLINLSYFENILKHK